MTDNKIGTMAWLDLSVTNATEESHFMKMLLAGKAKIFPWENMMIMPCLSQLIVKL